MTASKTNQISPDRHTISESTKLADLLELNFNIAGVLSRVGLSFGFGDDSVQEACEKHGVNVETFLLICKVYTFEGYRPSEERLKEVDIKDIVRYLHNSHSYYMDIVQTDLVAALEAVMEPCDERQKKVIKRFYDQYKDELSRHFSLEEQHVFPYINSVLDHRKDPKYNILQYEENHTDVEAKLCDLRNIVMKYLPPQCDAKRTYTALMLLFTLEKDLQKHTFIEDEILVPIVNRLEENEL